MKRTVFLILFLTALGGFTWYTLKTKTTKEYMPASNSLYAIDDISRVQKAGIIHNDGTKYVFDRIPDGWLVNGKKANTSVVNTFLNTVRQLRILYATPPTMTETMLKDLAIDRLKVELYDKDNILLQKFYVGSVSTDGNSTYFIKEDSNKPHLVGIPNFHGSVRHNFNRPASDWANKMIYELKPEEIKSVFIEYPNLKNHSFKLSKKGVNFDVSPFYDINPTSKKKRRMGAAKTFLSFFHKIGAEAIETNPVLIDSIKNLAPFAIIKLQMLDHTESVTRVFPFLPEGVSSIEELGPQDRDQSSAIGVNRYFVINDETCFLAQNRVLGKVLWNYQDFFEK